MIIKELPIQITPKALAEISHIMERKNIPQGYFLRVGMKGGGCSGTTFMLGFDTPKEKDDQFTIDKIPVLIDKKHTMYLLGLTIDFIDTDDSRGFVFLNPGETSKD